MNFYWAGAGSFVFFMLIGVLGGSMLHLEGPRWYFFMGLMAALGLSSFALFYYFQRKAQERRSGGSSSNSADAGANETERCDTCSDAARESIGLSVRKNAVLGITTPAAITRFGTLSTVYY